MSEPKLKRSNTEPLVDPTGSKKSRLNENKESMAKPTYKSRELEKKREFMASIPQDSLCAAYMNIREQISQQQRFNDYVLMYLNKKPVLINTDKYIVHNNNYIVEDLNVTEEEKIDLTIKTFSLMGDIARPELDLLGNVFQSVPPFRPHVMTITRNPSAEEIWNATKLPPNVIAQLPSFTKPEIIDTPELNYWFDEFLKIDTNLWQLNNPGVDVGLYAMNPALMDLGYRIQRVKNGDDGTIRILEGNEYKVMMSPQRNAGEDTSGIDENMAGVEETLSEENKS